MSLSITTKRHQSIPTSLIKYIQICVLLLLLIITMSYHYYEPILSHRWAKPPPLYSCSLSTPYEGESSVATVFRLKLFSISNHTQVIDQIHIGKCTYHEIRYKVLVAVLKTNNYCQYPSALVILHEVFYIDPDPSDATRDQRAEACLADRICSLT